MINPFPLLTSQRLRLRALDAQDEQEVFALRSNEQVNLHLDREPAKSITDAQKFILNISAMIEKGDGLYWAICLKENPRLIGTICYFNFSTADSSAEIGFELLPFYQGKGIMHEAISIVIQYGFQVLQLKKIMGVVSEVNFNSIKILKKNGFIESSRVAENEKLVNYLLER